MSNIENTINFVMKENVYGLTEKEWNDYLFGSSLPGRKQEIQAKIDRLSKSKQ
jgi:hypothetical protein